MDAGTTEAQDAHVESDWLPDEHFDHSPALLERHDRNVNRFLEAVRDLIRKDVSQRIVFARVQTDRVDAEAWEKGNRSAFVARVPRNPLLDQAVDMGFDAAYFVPEAFWDGGDEPPKVFPKEIPRFWVALARSVSPLRFEEDLYIFRQAFDGDPVAGQSGIIIGRPRSGNRILESFLQTLRDNPDRFPIFTAVELFSLSEDSIRDGEPFNNPSLNFDQNRVISHFGANPVTLIQGPPGTGKSTTLGVVIETGVSAGMKFLCSSNTNKAIDSIAEKLVQLRNNAKDGLLDQLFEQSRVTRYGTSINPHRIREILFSPKAAKVGADESMCKDAVSICTNYRVLGLEKINLFDCVVIDEVGTVALPHLYCVACLAKKKVVACGDPEQLPPVFPYNGVSATTKALFKWNIYRANKIRTRQGEAPDRRIIVLTEQHRMPDELAELVRLTGLYRRYVTSSHYRGPGIEGRRAIDVEPFPGKCLTVVDTSNLRSRYCDRANQIHQELVQLLIGFYSRTPQFHTGYIAPYRPQAAGLWRWSRANKIKNLLCGTVHQFQGSEFPLVIWDTVESDPASAINPSLRFTDELRYPEETLNLLNVAVSRSTAKLMVIANIDYVLKNLSSGCFMHRVINYAASLNSIEPAELLLRRLGLTLGESSASLPQYFPRDPIFVDCSSDDSQFDTMILNDLKAAQHRVSVLNTRAEVGHLYKLVRDLDPVSETNALLVDLYLPRNLDRDAKGMIADLGKSRPHFRFPHPKKWRYNRRAFVVLDDRLSYLMDVDGDLPSLANGELPLGFTRLVSG